MALKITKIKKEISESDFIKYKKIAPFNSWRDKSKCFVSGTKLLTNFGWIKVEDFIPEINPGEFSDYQGKIKIINWQDEQEDIFQTYYGLENKIVYFLLSDNSEIKVTLDHKFPVVCNDGQTIELPASEIKADKHRFIDIGDNAQLRYLSIRIKRIDFLKEEVPVYCVMTKSHQLIMQGFNYDSEILTKNSINFGFLFGRSPVSFALDDLTLAWSLEEVENYILENHLEEDEEKHKETFENISAIDIKYVTVSIDIQKKFFDLYKGFKRRIEERFEEAKTNGYLRSVFGSVAHFPEYLFAGKDDRKYYAKFFAGLKNNTSNITIQQFESAMMQRVIFRLKDIIKQNNLKSRVFGTVHDSVDIYIHRDEIIFMMNTIRDLMNYDSPENEGLPLDCEIKLADPVKGEIYKEGKEYKFQ